MAKSKGTNRRPPPIDVIDAEEFIRRKADPVWQHQNGHHEVLHEQFMEEERENPPLPS